jgi:hypothetical protein
LIEHWDGAQWMVVPSPTHGTASALLDSVVGSDGKVWAVGETDDPAMGGHPLVEEFKDGVWTTVDLPPAGSKFISLWGVAAANDKVWAVGTFVDPTSGNNETLIFRHDETGWSVVIGPNPGSGSNLLGGIASSGDDGSLWAVGIFDDEGSNLPLIERHAS